MRPFICKPSHTKMNDYFSWYRLYIPTIEVDRFFDVLQRIRPNENKIQRISPESITTKVDVIISNEELSILRLSILNLGADWLHYYKY